MVYEGLKRPENRRMSNSRARLRRWYIPLFMCSRGMSSGRELDHALEVKSRLELDRDDWHLWRWFWMMSGGSRHALEGAALSSGRASPSTAAAAAGGLRSDLANAMACSAT